jgi:hypothetical protein
VDGGQVGVSGIAVTHEDAGELREYPTGVDIVARAPTDVHQRQIFGARHMHIRQRPGGTPGGLVGMQHRRGAEQRPHVREEPGFQRDGTAPADPGEEPGGHRDSGALRQQGGGAGDRQVMPAGQQCGQRRGPRPDTHRTPRTQHQRHYRIGRTGSAKFGSGSGSGLRGVDGGIGLPPVALFRGALARHPPIMIWSDWARYIGGGGFADMPTPVATFRHQLIFGDLRWWRRDHIHHLTTHSRGLGGILKRLLTPSTPIRGHLEYRIRILGQLPRRRRRTLLLSQFPPGPSP